MYYVASPNHTSTSSSVKHLLHKVKASLAKGEQHVSGTLVGDAFFPTKSATQTKRL